MIGNEQKSVFIYLYVKCIYEWKTTYIVILTF